MKSKKLTYITAIAFVAALAIPVATAAQNSPSEAPKLKHHTYRLGDIGTLGGFFNSRSVCRDLPTNNNRG
jgi:hypothetical protein